MKEAGRRKRQMKRQDDERSRMTKKAGRSKRQDSERGRMMK
jgi:hypothetical protein